MFIDWNAKYSFRKILQKCAGMKNCFKYCVINLNIWISMHEKTILSAQNCIGRCIYKYADILRNNFFYSHTELEMLIPKFHFEFWEGNIGLQGGGGVQSSNCHYIGYLFYTSLYRDLYKKLSCISLHLAESNNTRYNPDLLLNHTYTLFLNIQQFYFQLRLSIKHRRK